MQFLKQHSSKYVSSGTQSLALLGHVWRIWVPGLSLKTKGTKNSMVLMIWGTSARFWCKRRNPQDFPSSLLHLQRPLVSCVQDLRCSKPLSQVFSSEMDIVPAGEEKKLVRKEEFFFAGARWWRRLASALPVSPNSSNIELSSSFNQSSPPSFSSFKGKLATTIITFVTFCSTEITFLNGLHCHQKIYFYWSRFCSKSGARVVTSSGVTAVRFILHNCFCPGYVQLSVLIEMMAY